MTALRVRVHLGADPRSGILGMVGWSITGHILFLALMVFLPRVIPHRPPPPILLTASIVSMPGDSAPAAPQQPAPERTGPTPEERAEMAARKQRVVKPPPEKTPEPRPDTKTPPPPGKKPAAEPPPAAESAPPPEERKAPEPAAPLSEGVGLGAGGTEVQGGIPSITSASFPYQYYRTILVNQIRSRWSRPLTPGLSGSLRCAVSFVITQDGKVGDVALPVSSGFPPLDDSAVQAVIEASPFPPLPFQYSSGSVRAAMIFELTPD